MIFYNSLEPIATPLHLLVVFSVTYYSELHNVVTLCQVKSFILCIIYVTYSIFVGNQWNLWQEVIAFHNKNNKLHKMP